MTFVLPIYWTKQRKSKPTTHLVGMNFYRNAHYFDQNKLKQDFQQILADQFTDLQTFTTYKVHYELYYKNPSCDGSNVIALMEKFFLDFAQSMGITPNDNVNYHLGSSWSIGGQDKTNPRCVITITEA